MTILYHSTRGKAPEADFRGVTLGGLAPDGGLYVPKAWPEFEVAQIAALQDMSYPEIAGRILQPFIGPAIAEADMQNLLQEAYGVFEDKAVTPLRQLDERLWALELFHGPTLAFKDLALELLGRVFEYFLASENKHTTVIGATSGDTGSAAMAALAGRRNIDVFILYPHKGPSEMQRRQMTCIEAPNVHALAVEGSFDDCQAIVKKLFGDPALRAKYNFAAINSINMFRILAQMVYYFVAAMRLPQAGAQIGPASFVVPTGNFGNVYAGYAAMKCGLPISKLAVASNKNDVLTRFFTSGQMKASSVEPTLSPSMDIQISSNFERLLFDLCNGNGAHTAAFLEEGHLKGEFAVSKVQFATARQIFTAASANDEETLQSIRDTHRDYNYICDPHSAVGFAAAKKLTRELPDPVVVLATAHPAKFPDTIKRALGIDLPTPKALADLGCKTERTTLLPADAQAIEAFMAKKRIT